MTNLNVVEFGTGAPVLALHGAYSTHHEIAGPLQDLLPDRRIICPDLPGHGASIEVGATSAGQAVDLLEHLVEELVGAEPLVLIGHSYGAHLARGLAARRPEQVSSLLLICPLVPIDMRPEPAQVVVDDGAADSLPTELRAEFDGYFAVRTAATVAAFMEHVGPALNQFDPSSVAAQLENSALELPPAGEDFPVSVLVGRRDSLIGWRQYEHLLDAYPRASVIIVADAGHALPHEAPQAMQYAVQLLR